MCYRPSWRRRRKPLGTQHGSGNTAVWMLAAPVLTPRASQISTAFTIPVSLSFCRFPNGMNQSLMPAMYPILKAAYRLDFAQIGMITLAFRLSASWLQPVVGIITDKRPQPFSLPIGRACSLIGDRIGRKPVIWAAIWGAFPFALMLPYAGPMWTAILSVLIGVILASAIVVHAQELLPRRVGCVSRMVFGFSFGLGGPGAAMLGEIADMTGIETVHRAGSFLPRAGLLTALLPNIERQS